MYGKSFNDITDVMSSVLSDNLGGLIPKDKILEIFNKYIGDTTMAKVKLNINTIGGKMNVADATKIAGNPEEYSFNECVEAFNVLSKVQEEFEKRADNIMGRLHTIGVGELKKLGIDGVTTEYLDSVLTVKAEEVDEFILDDAVLKASPTAKSYVKIVQTLERAKIKKAYKEGRLDPADASAITVNKITQLKMRRVNKVSGTAAPSIKGGNDDE